MALSGTTHFWGYGLQHCVWFKGLELFQQKGYGADDSPGNMV